MPDRRPSPRRPFTGYAERAPKDTALGFAALMDALQGLLRSSTL